MRLIEALERRLDSEQSFFQSQLLREDIERLARMRGLVGSTPDAAAFRKTALRLGWTAGDLRTHEIRIPLEGLADAIYAYETGARGAEQEACVEQAWIVLHRVRMERLMGCLSTPAPKPVS